MLHLIQKIRPRIAILSAHAAWYTAYVVYYLFSGGFRGYRWSREPEKHFVIQS